MKHLMTLLALVVAVTAGAQVETPMFSYNPDSDSDGIIGIEDLLSVLSLFGGEFTVYDLTIEEDSSSAALFLGEQKFWNCHHACDTLTGNWRMLQLHDAYIIDDTLSTLLSNSDASIWCGNEGNYLWNLTGSHVYASLQSYNNMETTRQCICYTKAVPAIEYSICDVYNDQEAFVNCVNEKLGNGWRPLGGTASRQSGYYPIWSQGFWRWAE